MKETAAFLNFRDEIAHSLLSAHIPIPATRYLQYGLLVTLLAAFLYVLSALFLSHLRGRVQHPPLLPLRRYRSGRLCRHRRSAAPWYLLLPPPPG